MDSVYYVSSGFWVKIGFYPLLGTLSSSSVNSLANLSLVSNSFKTPASIASISSFPPPLFVVTVYYYPACLHYCLLFL